MMKKNISAAGKCLIVIMTICLRTLSRKCVYIHTYTLYTLDTVKKSRYLIALDVGENILLCWLIPY